MKCVILTGNIDRGRARFHKGGHNAVYTLKITFFALQRHIFRVFHPQQVNTRVGFHVAFRDNKFELNDD